MDKKIIILIIILSVLAIYLQRSYAKIYNRIEPNLAGLSWSSPVTINNPNFQNTVKYVALGDSLTFGTGSTDMKRTLPFIFASKLSKQMSVVFVNLAVSGTTTEDLINNQLNQAAAQKPNYITLLVGTNDLHSLTSSSKFRENMEQIINFLKNRTLAKIIVFNIPYLGSDDLIPFPYNSFFDNRVNQYNRIISDLCKKNDVVLIDLYNPTKDKFSKEPGFYSSDNFHPSAEGYSLWGTLISPEDL